MAEAASSSAGASEPETQQFGNVLLAGKDQHREENLGTLRMHSGGFGWKSKKTGHVIAISKSDLRGAEWAKAPPYACMLKLRAKGGFSHTFVGLRSQDRGVVGDYCARVFELDLKDVAFSWKGWNWGEALVEGTSLAFRVEDKAALEIPLAAVSQAIASNRKEAIIELADDDTAAPEDEMVVGIRFHVPAAARDDEADEEELAPAETLVAQIKESGDLEASGTSLATFEDVGLTVPRGRYDIEMFDKFLKLHGKTYDYKVLYTNVASVYVLPKQDNYTMAFVVSLEHPLRQGATMYPHIVMQLPRDATVDLEIALDSAELKRRFDDKLERSESGELVDLLPKVMCAFTKKKVVRPKVGGFNGEKEDKLPRPRASASIAQANDGFLYPLDKCFFFVANKPLHIDFERIGSLEFNRSARTFDITLYMRDGSSHQFVNLQRSDYKELFAFLQGKQIKIRNLAAANKANADDADDESDGGEEEPRAADLETHHGASREVPASRRRGPVYGSHQAAAREQQRRGRRDGRRRRRRRRRLGGGRGLRARRGV
ncbi:hypothetical protein EMIHUDRAFT_414529 [Emiliania huxleyi CCMP1516]|uniref:FACT complex subunit SSRP1 n=2 Tax=Emiliania huxleyi TaxID=2903 RepID=A0A0D3J3L2_EMIH1|nr:hypothetical protein EMIHUDRAFT_414529 [Emiliania huxleyi CCMP1516]EOD18097.1 hypothetical protein EMIHUDRAFT_414529 [Emiliania huxleyi CCMP1516]|eukprot:XP_005770526.1 hypothetical protein EMIHUDRAFT_414529 [Emiliania huxleyi CCMP1516]